jgi:putative endonuclease
MVNKKALGEKGEEIAAKYLKNCGMEIITMNYRCKIGEIDIIAREGNTYVICEVKYRSNNSFGYPIEAVDYKKQQKITQVTKHYIMTNRLPDDISVRFDVIGILGKKITHIKDAF